VHILDMLVNDRKYRINEVARTGFINDNNYLGTTGIAAQLIRGQTLDSWAGFTPQLLEDCGYGRVDVKEVAAAFVLHISRHNRPALERWISAKVLFIDEGMIFAYQDLGSMLEAEKFKLLNEISRLINNHSIDFGCIQLIISADFLQLRPPGQKESDLYLFETELWKRSIVNSYEV
jgi:hypothetical protein